LGIFLSALLKPARTRLDAIQPWTRERKAAMPKGFLTRRPTVAAAMLGVVVALSVAVAAASTTTFNAANAPTGTHVQSGSPTCSVGSNNLVTCSTYQLAGVGNANATGSLDATYTATVQCRNHGGQIVEVKSQAESTPTSTGSLSPKNGKLTVPSLNSGPVPSASDFEAMATCPNGNWTKELESGTVTLSSFTYTLTFAGFSGPYITITGP
jgi:hypothetical protein